MENTVKPVKVPHVRAREQGDDLALFDVITAKYFVLNEVGRETWNLCTGEYTLEEIAKEIQNKIEGAPSFDEILADVKELVTDLKEKNLVQVDT